MSTLLFLCISLTAVAAVRACAAPHCSGVDVSNLPNLDLTKLSGTYFTHYLIDESPTVSVGPIEPLVTIRGPSMTGFNKIVVTMAGRNPNGGGCLKWFGKGFKIRDRLPCMDMRLIQPQTCGDDEWIYWKISPDNIVNYYCFKLNNDGSCSGKIVSALSRKKKLSSTDVEVFRNAFATFNSTLPKPSGIMNNPCQKIEDEIKNFVEADNRHVFNEYSRY